VSGVPAKVVGGLNTLVAFRAQQTQQLPWADLLNARGTSGFDPAMEPELLARRVAYFFPKTGEAAPASESFGPAATAVSSDTNG